MLADLWLYAMDDQTVTLMAQMNGAPSDSDLQPILDSISQAFQSLNIAQRTTVNICMTDGAPSSGSRSSPASASGDGAPTSAPSPSAEP